MATVSAGAAAPVPGPPNTASSPQASNAKSNVQDTVTPALQALQPSFRHQLRRLWTSFGHYLSQRDNDWAWEVSSILLSIASTIAIVAILSVYNHQKFPQVPSDISLNAVVATLSTVAKSSLIFAVSAAIGQLKWDWYEQEPHKLEDLETFDAASRGPLGAAKLLFGRHTMFSTASIGAIVTVLALGVEPFVQQVIGTAEQVSFVPSDEVWTPRMTRPSFFPLPGTMGNDSEYLQLLTGAVWNSAETYNHRAHCPSGDCQFDSFETLEFCVDSGIVEDVLTLDWNCSARWDWRIFEGIFKIWDQDRRIQTHSEECKVWFGRNQNNTPYLEYPIIYSLSRFGGQDISDTPGKPRPLIGFPFSVLKWLSGDESNEVSDSSLIRVPRPLVSFGFIRISDTDPLTLRALDFRYPKLEWAEWAVLGLCKATRKISVTNGVTTVSYENGRPEIGHQYVIFKNNSGSINEGLEPWYCWAPKGAGTPDLTSLPAQIDLPSGNVSQFVSDPTAMTFCSTFTGWADDVGFRLKSAFTKDRLMSRTNWTGSNPEILNPKPGVTTTDPGFYEPESAKDVFTRVENITLGSMVRSMAAALNNISFARSQEEPVRGSVRVTDTVVEVRWAWLSLLLALELLGLVLLVAVRVRKRQVAGLWKDSLLASLYNGLDREDDSLQLGVGRTMVDIKEKAKVTRVRLARDGERIMLSSA